MYKTIKLKKPVDHDIPCKPKDWSWLREYDMICKRLCFRMYNHVNGVMFNPSHLANDHKFRESISKVNDDYKKWIKNQGNVGRWDIWAYSDRWIKFIKRCVKMGFLKPIYNQHNVPTGDYKFDNINELSKDVFAEEL